jgi:hypothetical protein
MDERRRKGLCYSCDANWSRGHVCVVPKLFLIEVVEEHKKVTEVISIDKEKEDPGQFFLDEEPKISLNAITKTPNSKTMRLLEFKEANKY